MTGRAPLIILQTKAQGDLDASGGIHFTLTTDSPDLTGDIVVQSGLSLARDPLPAMIDHGGGLNDLIGSWHNFEFGQHSTRAVLRLLDPGTSPAADLVRKLYEQGVKLAASIGFVPARDKYELLRDPKNDRVTGVRWLESTLTEASVVVTPANPEALALAKSLHPKATGLGLLPNENARAAIVSRLLGTPVPAQAGSAHKRVATMNIGEQIRAAEAALNALRDKALAATKSLEGATEEEARAALIAEMDAVNEQVETTQKQLSTLKRTEQTLAARAVEADPIAPAILGTPRVPDKQKSNLIIRAGVLSFEAYCRRLPVSQVLEERYGHDPMMEATKGVMSFLQQTKATPQNPAMVSVPAWAGALVRDGYGAFMEELQRDSVVPRIPMQNEEFNGFGSITVASRTGAPTAAPNLAAAFRGEGQPIRVGSVALGSKKLTPKSMGIIGTFTMELFRRSTPNIENKIREWMLSDTAIALDSAFLSAAAGTATSPAGIANGLAAGDTAVSGGVTVAAITADLRARVQSMYGQGLGRRPVWVMNPARLAGLALATTAAGTLAFPTAADATPTLLTFPVVTSITVPSGNVYLVDAAELVFAGGAPEFLGSEVATIHEEYDAVDVKAIIDGAGVEAKPVRSLYQTFSAALRAVWEVDWAVLRAGAVQLITAAAW